MARSERRRDRASGGRPWALVLAAPLLAASCSCGTSSGPSDAEDTDGAAGDGQDDAPLVTPPAPPAPPTLVPCPTGWREVPPTGADGVATCDPWPEGGPQSCADDEAHFPGDPGCTRVGTACPASDWATDLPADGTVLYVRAGAPAGGSGAETLPFGTIAEATAAARAGTTIALSRGIFDEPVLLAAGVTLWGACTADTLVTSTNPSTTAGVVTVRGTGATVRNLRIGGRRPGVWVVDARRSVDLQDVVIAETDWLGCVAAIGTEITGRNVVVRDTRSRPDTREDGIGLAVQQGARAELARAVFLRNRSNGVLVVDGGSGLTLTDVAVLDTQSRERDGGLGRGVEAEGGPSLALARTVLQGNRDVGLVVGGAGTTADLDDVVVRGTQARDSDGDYGYGVFVLGGAQATGSRIGVEGNRGVGVLVSRAGTTAELTDLVVTDTEALLRDGSLGRGLNVQYGARVEVSRALVENNRDVGIFAGEEEAFLVLADIVVRGTRSRDADQTTGRGVIAENTASVEMTRAVVERNRDLSISAGWLGTQVVLTDVAVRDTLPRDCVPAGCDASGVGIGAYAGGHLSATRFLVTDSALCGVQIAYALDPAGVPYPYPGSMDLSDGEISRNTIGLNIQIATFDLGRVMDRVAWSENGLDLDSAALPVPSPDSPL